VPLGPPLQQPFGHDAASHSHTPEPLQVCPLGQRLHVAPPLPQEVPLCDEYGSHVPVLQQPMGQEVESHVQTPAEHSWP
jgi:hypothetical protein